MSSLSMAGRGSFFPLARQTNSDDDAITGTSAAFCSHFVRCGPFLNWCRQRVSKRGDGFWRNADRFGWRAVEAELESGKRQAQRFPNL